ncbi:MAG: stalk domain-containing protein [Defluviitaleaceae bacterium]|nr:stalk domain-containing protein [Defluviitaleaceae bacterium]
MKQRVQGMIIGSLITLLLLGATTAVIASSRTIQATYGVGVVVNGVRQNFPDDMRPFISEGRTFLPVRGIAEALDVDVMWEGATQTVYVGTLPRQTTTTHLFNKPFSEVRTSAWFRTSGNEHQNSIQFLPTLIWLSDSPHRNHVVYELDMLQSSVFHATFNPITGGRVSTDVVYSVYGDDRLLYTSPIMHPRVSPIPIEVDVSGVRFLRIEIVATSPGTTGNSHIGQQRGVENARIVTTPW